VDQAAPEHQTLLRHFRERCADAIWIGISVYVLVAIIQKKLRLDVSLHTLLQILSLTLFEKLPLKKALAGVEPIEPAFYRQLNLIRRAVETTVEVSDELYRRAKWEAALRGRKLKDLVEEGLRLDARNSTRHA
jgi:hypothetical protein